MTTGMGESSGEQLAARFVQAAATFTRARPFSADILVQFGDVPMLVRVRDGVVTELQTQLPPLCPWDFAVRGSERAWLAFWQSVPAPGWHDLFALSKRGEFDIAGNLQPLMANLQYVKDLLAIGREEQA